MTGIREYQKLIGREPKRAIRVGDIVHIRADKLPRQQWKIGKVEKLLRRRDNEVRAAEVKTLDSSLRKVRLKRPIQKLYLLETRVRDENNIAVRVVVGSGTNIQMVGDEDVPVVVVAP